MVKRPPAIRVICLIGFARAAAVPLLAFLSRDVSRSLAEVRKQFSEEFAEEVFGRSDRIIAGIFVYMSIMFVSMVGMWLMRKWGAVLYAVLVGAIWLLFLAGKAPGAPWLDTILAPVALFYLRDMTWKVNRASN